MIYQRPSGGTFTTLGPETDEQVRSGTNSTYTYEGTLAEMQSQRIVERFAGASRLNLRPSGNGLWQLQSTFPFSDDSTGPETEEPQDLHEIEVQVEQIPVWNSEQLRTRIGDDDIARVKRWVDNYMSGAPIEGVSTKNPTKAQYITAMQLETTDDTDAAYLFNRVASGTDSAIEYREVYRRTLTAASYHQIQASYEGVGQIWKTSEVISWESIPNAEWFGLRLGMQWLKAPPSVQAISGGKTQIQYYYTEFKQATSLLYVAYNGATLLD